MKNRLAGFLAAVIMLLCSPFASVAQVDLPLSREEARNAVEMMAGMMNSANMQSRMANVLGDEISVSARVDGDNLALSYIYPGFAATSPDAAVQLAKFMIAVNRSDKSKVASFDLLAELLSRAGYNMYAEYRGSADSAPVATFTLTPAQMRSLITEPYSELGLDYDVVLNELIYQLKKGAASEQLDEGVRSLDIFREGAYIKIVCEVDPEGGDNLVKVDDDALRDYFLALAGAEKGADFHFSLLSKAGAVLGLKGLKLDYRVADGTQKVVIIPWERLLAGMERKSETPNIDLFVSSVNTSLKNMTAPGLLKAQSRYAAPFIEVVFVYDADEDGIANIDAQEQKYADLVRLSADDSKAAVAELMKEGMKGYRYIHCSRDMSARKVIEIMADEIMEFNPDGNSKFSSF